VLIGITVVVAGCSLEKFEKLCVVVVVSITVSWMRFKAVDGGNSVEFVVSRLAFCGTLGATVGLSRSSGTSVALRVDVLGVGAFVVETGRVFR
jgi:hypothetical protein